MASRSGRSRRSYRQAAGLNGDESPECPAQEIIRSLVAPAADADLVAERVAETIGLVETTPGHRGHFWAVARFLEEMARRRPLVAVFDDIHWAEPTFLDLMEAVIEQAREQPLLVLCMARPELLEVRASWRCPADTVSKLRPDPP